MWNIPRLWEGGSCVILGGGPSLPRQFGVPESLIQAVYTKKVNPDAYSPYMARIHKEHVLAVNMAYKFGSWIDCMFFGDESFYYNNRLDLFDFKGLRVTCASKVQERDGFLKIILRDKDKKLGITNKPGCISWNANSGGSAINLAVQFGVKRIILLGFDMKLDSNNNQHWHKYYAGNKNTVGTTMSLHLKCFPFIANDLRGKVEIINCSPDSAITCFPKVHISEIFPDVIKK